MPLRSIGTDDITPAGGFITRTHKYTLATYSAAGTTAPAVGDIVSPTTTNDRVVLTPDDTTKFFGRVKYVDTANLTLVVEWIDVHAFVELTCDDLSTVTLNNSAIKDGNTTVVDNFDAGATTGNLYVISKSGTSGAGTICAAVLIG